MFLDQNFAKRICQAHKTCQKSGYVFIATAIHRTKDPKLATVTQHKTWYKRSRQRRRVWLSWRLGPILHNILLSPSDWAKPCSGSCLKAGKRLGSARPTARILARLPRARASALLLWTLRLPTSHACEFGQCRLVGPLIACVSLPFSLLLETSSTLFGSATHARAKLRLKKCCRFAFS